jgi:magnesium-transporting ATPase (P-type)
MFGKDSLFAMLGIGGLIAGATFGAYVYGRAAGDAALASQLTFATLVGSQLAASFAFRSELRSVFQLPRNQWLVAAVGASALALLAVFHVPVLQETFDTRALGPSEWAVVCALSVLPFVVTEALKLSGLATRLITAR